MKAAVITFPASNCDRDALLTLRNIGFNAQSIWHQERNLDDKLDLIVIPGGFSFGDYLRCGAMAAISPIMSEVKRLSEKGVKILGICNGFQILAESGLLPGVLTRNKQTKFACKDVYLRVENTDSAFTKNYKKNQVIRLPIAHADGNYFASTEILKKLEDNENIAFRYVDKNGNVTDDSNPNGSMLNIAGITNDNRNILGMMPHPERATDDEIGYKDGLTLFKSLF